MGDVRLESFAAGTLPIEVRDHLSEAVRALLHDWIKYMEMRLLSIDWSDPPEDVGRHMGLAIINTRRIGERSQGIRTIWQNWRTGLASIGGDLIDGLITALDDDVDRLEEFTRWDDAALIQSSDSIEQVVRRPGRTLRYVRDALLELELE